MSLGKNLASTIVAAVQHEMAKYIDAYTAVVTAVVAEGVQIRRIGETVGSVETYARVSDLVYSVDDEVFVITVRGRPFVLGVVRRANAGTPTATVLSAAGIDAECTIAGTDFQGQISFTAGSASVSAGNMFTFNFDEEKDDANYAVILTSGSNASGDLQGRMNYVTRTTTGWTMNYRVAPTTSAVYNWSYMIKPYSR